MDDRLHSETDTKRMKPVVRSMVLGDLVFLAVFQLLDMQGMISEEISTFSAAVAAIVMIYAMVVQFKAEKDTSTGSGRRLWWTYIRMSKKASHRSDAFFICVLDKKIYNSKK